MSAIQFSILECAVKLWEVTDKGRSDSSNIGLNALAFMIKHDNSPYTRHTQPKTNVGGYVTNWLKVNLLVFADVVFWRSSSEGISFCVWLQLGVTYAFQD